MYEFSFVYEFFQFLTVTALLLAAQLALSHPLVYYPYGTSGGAGASAAASAAAGANGGYYDYPPM